MVSDTWKIQMLLWRRGSNPESRRGSPSTKPIPDQAYVYPLEFKFQTAIRDSPVFPARVWAHVNRVELPPGLSARILFASALQLPSSAAFAFASQRLPIFSTAFRAFFLDLPIKQVLNH